MSLPADSFYEERDALHFTQPGLSMPAAAGVVHEKGSEYILAHTGPRELDGHPLGVCGSGFGLVPGYTTLSVRVWANIYFGALKIQSVRTNVAFLFPTNKQMRNDIVGHMWHHLRARIDNIRLRVLHPNIQEHQTIDILRGLPEGSRLSPTLFGIFVADLIHELQNKFLHGVINLAPGLQHNGTAQIWIGGLLYVDDLALMSTCPRELQAMLHVCQE